MHAFPIPSYRIRFVALTFSRREDSNSNALWHSTTEDAKLYRMSYPEQVHGSIEDQLLSARFGVEQGTKADGTPKAFAFDHV